MIRFIVSLLLLIAIQSSAQNSSIDIIEQYSVQEKWNPQKFGKLKSQLSSGNEYSSFDKFGVSNVDSAFIFCVDSFSVSGSLSRRKSTTEIYSVFIDNDVFCHFKTSFTKDSLIVINYLVIDSSGMERVSLKNDWLSFTKSSSSNQIININDLRFQEELSRLSTAFNIIFEENYEGRNLLHIDYSLKGEPLFSFNMDIGRNNINIISYHPTNATLSSGLALYLKFIYGRVNLIYNYLYLDYEFDNDSKFTNWFKHEYANILSKRDDIALEYNSNKLLVPFGVNIMIPFSRQIQVHKIPWHSYDVSNIRNYRE